MIQIPKHVKNLIPYKSGKPIDELVREKGLSKIVKLASNENPLGPSPKAVEAIRKNINEIHRYTDPSAYSLVNAIAAKINKRPGQIVTCSGSDSLIQYLITAFSDDEDELITSEGTFIGWYVNANKFGRNSIYTPLNKYQLDLDAIANAINKKTKIIYLANPNNPTGTMFTKKQFEEFMLKVPDNLLVVLDEAYSIYAGSYPGYINGLDYDLDNLIVLRTLSKAYGLAGIRIGYAVAKEYLIKEMYKVKLPFEPNYLAQVAAIAALEDDDFLQKIVALNTLSLNRMRKKFDELGIEYVPTYANFFLMLFSSEKFAVDFNNECLNRGLILRPVNSFGITNGIRINSGTGDETEFALNIIEEIYTKMTGSKYKNHPAEAGII
ncbi:MAG: histidinol-phosphate transaminase [Ignavibacteriaceae bacterium]|nr:histidinol-phosphate transaminase [Ignavibacteriaceae bacterium]